MVDAFGFADSELDGYDDDGGEPNEDDDDNNGGENTVPGCALRSLTRVDLRHIPGLTHNSKSAGLRALRAALCSFADIVLTG